MLRPVRGAPHPEAPNPGYRPGMKQGREYDFLRDDPRFQALYRRIGFP
jgi:hypothetical protein